MKWVFLSFKNLDAFHCQRDRNRSELKFSGKLERTLLLCVQLAALGIISQEAKVTKELSGWGSLFSFSNGGLLMNCSSSGFFNSNTLTNLQKMTSFSPDEKLVFKFGNKKN
jgi:hypothetical protein